MIEWGIGLGALIAVICIALAAVLTMINEKNDK